MDRFRNRVDVVLDDMMPCRLMIAGKPVTGSCPGGRLQTDFVAGGEETNLRFPFRVPKIQLPGPLAVGDSVEWLLESGETLALEVADFSQRPHESRFQFTCKKRRV